MARKNVRDTSDLDVFGARKIFEAPAIYDDRSTIIHFEKSNGY